MCGGLAKICGRGGEGDTDRISDIFGDNPDRNAGAEGGSTIASNPESGPSLFESLVREERELRPQPIPGLAEKRRRRIRRLHSRTGFDIAVYPNGKVRGTTTPKNKYGSFEFEIAGRNGEMRIKGVMTGFYLTMTPKGRIIGQPLPELNGTVWIESRVTAQSAYVSFLSRDYAHHGWYLAMKKSGKPKAGHKTNHPYPQKSISFLTYVIAEEFY